jgi:drug/metabolite transporter (DMT)-like permease
MSERIKIFVAYAAICLIWGSTWLVIKIGLETITPFLSAGLRFVVASLFLYAVIRMRGIKISWTKESQWFYFIVALTSFSVPFAMVYWGEQKISSGLTSILFAVFPFCVAIISSIMIPNEKLGLAKILGIIIGFSGVVIIFANDVHLTNSEQLIGMTVVLGSAVIQAFSAVLIKKHGHHISPFVVSFVPMAIASILLLLGSLFIENYSTVQFTTNAVLSIIFLGVFGSVVTFVSYFWLLKRIQVVILSMSAFITPVIAVLLGVIVLNEHVSTQLIIGAFLVLSGILSANFPELKRFLQESVSSK